MCLYVFKYYSNDYGFMERKGESCSTIEVLEKLKYDKDESKVDYIEWVKYIIVDLGG